VADLEICGLLQCGPDSQALAEGKAKAAASVLHLERPFRFVTLNVRAVELIAKPGKSRQLRACLRLDVMGYLQQRRGFLGCVLLTSHGEPRLNLILSFWSREEQAHDHPWENSPAVRRLVSPLADVCKKVQTYEAALPTSAAVLLQSLRARAS